MMHLHNAMFAAAERSQSAIAKPRLGLVSGYDPNMYMVKVLLQPENVETGWLPLGSPMVGNQFGIFGGPAIGDQVEVQFPDGDLSSGIVSMRFFNDQARPLAVPSGEVWIVHKSGSFLKLHNDGSIEMNAAAGISYTGTGHAFHGPVTMDKTLQATGQITGQGGMAISGGSGASVAGSMAITGGNVTADGIGLKTHTHTDPQGGTVGAPT
jgi:phage baseplate assembly protein V